MSKFEWIIYTIAGIAIFILTHDYATDIRGYDAIGGEAFLLLLPVYIYFGKMAYNEQKEMHRR